MNQFSRLGVPVGLVTAVSTLVAPVAATGTPASTEVSLAQALANGAAVQAATNSSDTIVFDKPGRYYLAGRWILKSRLKIQVAPGAEVWRHSGYVNQPWIHTIGTSQTTDVVIEGGGSIGRVADGTPGNDESHTCRFWTVRRLFIHDIIFRDTSGPLFSQRDGKYATYFNGAFDVYARNLGFIGGITEYGGTAVGSDAMHFSGACERVRVDNIWGAAVDNPLAIMNRDYGNYESFNNGTASVPFMNGSLRFFHITRVHFEGSAELVRFTGRFRPTVRVNDLDGAGGVAAEGDHTGVAWDPLTRIVSKTGIFTGYTPADGDFLLVTGGVGYKQAGPGGAPSANDVSTTQPLALPVIRKINNDQVEVGVIAREVSSATSGQTMTIRNGAYTTEEVSDILIDGVTGSVKPAFHGMGIGLDDTADPSGSPVLLTQALHRRITIRNVSITVPTAGYSMIQCAGIGLRELTLEGTMELGLGSAGDAAIFQNASPRTVMSIFDASRASWRARPSGTTSFSLFTFSASARVFKPGSFDVVTSQTAGACTLVNLAGSKLIVSRIDDFAAGDLRMEAISSGSLLRGIVCYNGNGAQVRRGIVNSLEMVNAAEGISGALNTGATAGLRSRFHVNQFRVIGTVAVAPVRAQADVTYDSLIRDTNSGELAFGAANDTRAAPSMQPSNTLTFAITHSDFTTAGPSQTLTLSALTRYAGYHLPRAASIVGVRVEVVTPFAATGLSAALLDVGIAATPDRFVTDLNAFAAGGTYATPSAANAYFGESAGWPALAVRLDTTGANLNTMTAGLVKITVTFE